MHTFIKSPYKVDKNTSFFLFQIKNVNSQLTLFAGIFLHCPSVIAAMKATDAVTMTISIASKTLKI